MGGFDLTNIQPLQRVQKPYPSPINTQSQVSSESRQEAKPQQPSDGVQTIEDALFKPMRTQLEDENGLMWQDKRPADFKAGHWSIDKFAEGPDQLPVDAQGYRVIRAAEAKGEPEEVDNG